MTQDGSTKGVINTNVKKYSLPLRIHKMPQWIGLPVYNNGKNLFGPSPSKQVAQNFPVDYKLHLITTSV